jgi:hypothetical protein
MPYILPHLGAGPSVLAIREAAAPPLDRDRCDQLELAAATIRRAWEDSICPSIYPGYRPLQADSCGFVQLQNS